LTNDNYVLATTEMTTADPDIGETTPLQLLQQAHHALTRWFDHWLSIPVCYYFYMPVATSGHLIYAVTMLSRWAKLCSSVSRPTARTSNLNGTGPGSAVSDASTSTTTAVATPPPAQLSSLLSTLRTTLLSHPELLPPQTLSVPAILSQMVTRFESARREITAAHGGYWHNGLWDIAAEKIRVKKALLDRWSEVVNLYGGEALLYGRRYWGRAGIGSMADRGKMTAMEMAVLTEEQQRREEGRCGGGVWAGD
jgi:hypothetical protein